MIGGSKGVHEIRKGAWKHFEKGIPDRVFFTATQSGMLQYMRHAGVIGRVGLEANGEDIIPVIPRNVQIVCSSLVMTQVESCEL